MKISTSVNVMEVESLHHVYSVAEGIKMIADVGFEAMDYSLTGSGIAWEEGVFTNPSDPEFAAYFRRAAAVATDHGVEIYQTHAPYCKPNCTDPAAYAILQKQIIRAVYATKYMNCPYIVVHPVLYPEFDNGQNREEALRTNLEFFAEMVPALKETDVTMCIENLYRGEYGQPKIANACSDAEQLREVVDTLNGTYGSHFAVCLDTTHAVVAGQDPIYMLKVLGDRVRTLHIHDTQGVLDDHQLPGRGIIDWKKFAQTLGEIGYQGTFNFEASVYQQEFTKEFFNAAVVKSAHGLMYDVGRSLADIAEKSKENFRKPN